MLRVARCTSAQCASVVELTRWEPGNLLADGSWSGGESRDVDVSCRQPFFVFTSLSHESFPRVVRTSYISIGPLDQDPGPWVVSKMRHFGIPV